MKHFWIVATILGLLPVVSFSQPVDEEPGEASLRIEKVSLFKNGLGFFHAGATLPTNAKTIRFGQLPVASFGTFWVAYPQDLNLDRLVTSLEDVEEKIPVQNIGQLLAANVGRRVTIHTDQDKIAGKVISGAAEPEPPQPPSPYFMDVRRPSDRYGRNMRSGPPGNLVLIGTDKGIVALNVGSIVRADFEPGDTMHSIATKAKRPSMRMELERPSNGEQVAVSYLAHGVTWAPSYLIDLSDPETAQFSAHALIVNELADFNEVQLELVTGFPNIKFGEILSPVAMSQGLDGFLNALASGSSEGRHGHGGMLAQQRVVMSNYAMDASFPSAPVPAYSTAAEGTVSEDLFLYPVKNFTLAKGETAWAPLFTAQMPYQHIYTWSIADTLDADERYRREQSSGPTPAEEVWHTCRLVNSLKMPLTTAATEFVKGGAFTGQDICYYTAPGAETTIRINRALNVMANEAEMEISRHRNSTTFNGRQYDLVKVKGELKIQSRLDNPIDVEIVKELSGSVLEYEPDAKDVPTAKGLKQINTRHVLTWQIELKPREERKLSYTYEVYIRN